jgi:hypothetical protein
MFHHIQSRGILLGEGERSVNHEGQEGPLRRTNLFSCFMPSWSFVSFVVIALVRLPEPRVI